MLSGLEVVVGLLGTIFALQGLGVPIGHGFMVGDLRWTVIGLVLVGAVAALTWRSRRP
jgi:hypothetical protein